MIQYDYQVKIIMFKNMNFSANIHIIHHLNLKVNVIVSKLEMENKILIMVVKVIRKLDN